MLNPLRNGTFQPVGNANDRLLQGEPVIRVEQLWRHSYFGYRYYSSEMGRWLSRDPLGEMGGVNFYLFVRNDSISLFDKLGLLTKMTNEELDNAYINREMKFYATELSPLDIVRILYSLPFDFLSGDFFRGRIEDSYKGSGCDFLLTVTGMNTNWTGNLIFNQKVKEIKKFRNADSNYVYNPTHGFILGDILEAIGNELGSIDTIARSIRDKINKAANVAQDRHCGGCYHIYVVAHSQGTMAVKRALSIIPSKVKKHIEIWGVGGEIAIADPDVIKCHNYANSKDPIPLANWLPTRLIDNYGSELRRFDTDIPHFSLNAHDALKYVEYLEDHIK